MSAQTMTKARGMEGQPRSAPTPMFGLLRKDLGTKDCESSKADLRLESREQMSQLK
jgi:hypothetical protein